RHTRCLSDWSSNVCSSDLRTSSLRAIRGQLLSLVLQFVRKLFDHRVSEHFASNSLHFTPRLFPLEVGFKAKNEVLSLADVLHSRSEERRVGKECRCRRRSD